MNVSIFNGITLMRGAEPDEVMEIQSGFRKRDGLPFVYQKRAVKSFRSAIQLLPPLVQFSRNRFLFCRGRNGSYCVYSNCLFGTAPDLTLPAVARLPMDVMHAWWADYEEARRLSPENIDKDLNFSFDIEVRLKSQNDRRRSNRCMLCSDGEICPGWEGEFFPFENPDDFAHLDEGGYPGMHILEGFCGLFGWPTPQSPEFPKFIESCTLYEYPTAPEYPEKPASIAFQNEALRWPWPEPRHAWLARLAKLFRN